MPGARRSTYGLHAADQAGDCFSPSNKANQLYAASGESKNITHVVSVGASYGFSGL